MILRQAFQIQPSWIINLAQKLALKEDDYDVTSPCACGCFLGRLRGLLFVATPALLEGLKKKRGEKEKREKKRSLSPGIHFYVDSVCRHVDGCRPAGVFQS